MELTYDYVTVTITDVMFMWQIYHTFLAEFTKEKEKN